jgi:hypothetical protein
MEPPRPSQHAPHSNALWGCVITWPGLQSPARTPPRAVRGMLLQRAAGTSACCPVHTSAVHNSPGAPSAQPRPHTTATLQHLGKVAR